MTPLRQKIALAFAALAIGTTGVVVATAGSQDETPQSARELIELTAELGDLADAWLAEHPVTTTAPATTTTALPVPAWEWPDATNTGWAGAGLALSDLTASGTITTTADGQVIDRKNVAGKIVVRHRDVVIKRSKVAANGYQIDNSGHPGLRADGTGHTVIEDTELVGTGTSAPAALASSKNYILRRVNVYGSIDGLKATGNVRIEQSWVHDQRKTSTSHNDAIQNSGTSDSGTGVYVWRSSIDGPYRETNAAIQAATNVGPINLFRIVETKLSGGNITVRMLDKGTGHGAPTNSGCWGCVLVVGSQTQSIGSTAQQADPYYLGHSFDMDGAVQRVGCVFSDGTPIVDR